MNASMPIELYGTPGIFCGSHQPASGSHAASKYGLSIGPCSTLAVGGQNHGP